MQIVLFYPSLIADWNNGNAHFLRGIVRELSAAGHAVTVYEPADGWSLGNMLAEHGPQAVQGFYAAYPGLDSVRYQLDRLDLDTVLATAQLVLVHEWNAPELVARIGAHRAHSDGYRLLFHDTHHRSITDRESMVTYDLRHYDGVLAFGAVIRDLYLREGWARRAWVWHEAADTQLFRPQPTEAPQDDLVWIGNWGDEERTTELYEFLLHPVRELGLRANVYGVRYPAAAQQALAQAGIRYHGWLANYNVPKIFSKHRITIHIPRRPYVCQLPGIPTIRPFEALACGIPLISAPWSDSERLFRAGRDYLVARNGTEMSQLLQLLLEEPLLARGLAEHGQRSLLARHTCRHRVEELLSIYAQLVSQQPLERQVGAATAI